MPEYGICIFMMYYNSVLFENIFVLKIVDVYKIWLDPKNICKLLL